MKFESSYLKEYLQVLQTASATMNIRFEHATKIMNSMEIDDTYIAVVSLTGGLAVTLKSLDGVMQGLKNVIELMESIEEEKDKEK